MNAIFDYNNAKVTFKNQEGEVFVNATEMAKSFNTKPDNWLRTEPALRMIEAISKSHICALADLVQVTKGGVEAGTWMHEDVALVFAQWLSPEFYLWCNSKIKELLKTGVSTVTNDDEAIAYAIRVLNQRMDEAKERNRQLEAKNELQNRVIEQVAPKAQYYDEVLNSTSTYLTNQIAKELGISAVTLNNKLHKLGVQYKQQEQWLLHAKYQNKNLTKTNTYPYRKSDGSTGTSMQTVWTEKGREFIHKLLNIKN